ncbi:MAG: LamG-like jellyroll fold domain-containing protein [Kiritimatiellales bacterium]
MKNMRFFLCLLLLPTEFVLSFQLAFDSEYRITLYKGTNATGPDVIALWQFMPGKETQDSSGNGHTLTLQGAGKFSSNGKFGSCLEGFSGQGRCGATAGYHASLSPVGAFTIELLINPKPELAETKSAYLIDKMAITGQHVQESMRDYMIRLDQKGTEHMITVYLGFGDTGGVSMYRSKAVAFTPGKWYHIAFVYDGNGYGRICVNNKIVGEETHAGREEITPGGRVVAIGERGVAGYAAFPGYIDQVRILNRAVPFGETELIALPAIGSKEWIDIYIDLSGGALTDWTYNRVACPNPKCEQYNQAIQYNAQGTRPKDLDVWSLSEPDIFTCPTCKKSFPGKEFPNTGQLIVRGKKMEFHQSADGKRFFLTPRLRYYKSLHALYTARDLAPLAETRNDPKLARSTLDILLAYAQMYQNNIFRTGRHIAGDKYYGEYYSNELSDDDALTYVTGWPNPANWGKLGHFGDYAWPSRMCETFEKLQATGVVTEEDRIAYKKFIEHMLNYATFAYYKQSGGLGNPSIQCRADIFKAVQTFPDLELHDFVYERDFGQERVLRGADAIHEIFEGVDGMFGLFGRYFYPDGLMHERAPAYQEMILSHLRKLIPEITGYTDPAGYTPSDPEWTRFENLNFGTEAFVQRCMTAPYDLSLPNGKVMPLGDTYHDTLDGIVEGESTVHPSWGVGILRAGTGTNTILTALNWGSTGDGHSHNDMLNIIFWNENQLLMTDLGYVIDRQDIRETWWRATAAAHNTVVVDAVNHPRIDSMGDPIVWAETPQFSTVQARSRHTYPDNQDFRRTLVLVGSTENPQQPRYAVDVFHVAGGKMHDYFLHAQSGIFEPVESFFTENLTLAPLSNQTRTLRDMTTGASSEKSTGYEHITALKTARVENKKVWNAVWDLGGEQNKKLKVFRLPEDSETVWVGLAPGHRYEKTNSSPDLERKMHKLVSRRTGTAPLQSIFTSVIEGYSGNAGRVRQAQRLTVKGNNSPAAVEVETDRGFDIIMAATAPGKMTIENRQITVDGQVAVISYDANRIPRAMMMVDGSQIQAGTAVVNATEATLAGTVTAHPGGVNVDLREEQMASIVVDFEVPSAAVGRTLFMNHAVGNRTVWTIKKVDALGNGATRLTLNLPARHQIKILQNAEENGTAIYPMVLDIAHKDRFFEPGLWCLFGDRWTQVKTVTDNGDTQKITFTVPVANIRQYFGRTYAVSHIGPGDSVSIPGITYWISEE